MEVNSTILGAFTGLVHGQFVTSQEVVKVVPESNTIEPQWILRDSRTNEIINPGDVIRDFRGEDLIYKHPTRLPSEGSNGKIACAYPHNGLEIEIYPSVIHAKFVLLL